MRRYGEKKILFDQLEHIRMLQNSTYDISRVRDCWLTRFDLGFTLIFFVCYYLYAHFERDNNLYCVFEVSLCSF